MLIKASDYRRPTDGKYAFRLQPLCPVLPAVGTTSDIREVSRRVLGEAAAARFGQVARRWTGPEDVLAGERPYAGEQLLFQELAAAQVTLAQLDEVLRGTVLVFRGPNGQRDYVMRDHHTLDVVLYEYAATGRLPAGLFHADRHSDWCDDRYLEARVPDQAATWWALLEGLKRPDGTGVIRERDVRFTSAMPERTPVMSGRDIGFSTHVPGSIDATALHFSEVLDTVEEGSAPWVSLDLDYFMPRAQFRLTRELLRHPRYLALHHAAPVRLFVLSPQFLNGGDRLEQWVTAGHRLSTLALLRTLLKI